jgi:hypothetical protein
MRQKLYNFDQISRLLAKKIRKISGFKIKQLLKTVYKCRFTNFQVPDTEAHNWEIIKVPGLFSLKRSRRPYDEVFAFKINAINFM